MEVLFDGFWEPVCSDFWDLHDANVVCRQLGYDGALAARVQESFDHEEGNINMKVCLGLLRCSGNESSILHCAHDGWIVVSSGGEIPRALTRRAGESIAICTPTGMYAVYSYVVKQIHRHIVDRL